MAMEVIEDKGAKYPMTYKWPDGMVAIIFNLRGYGVCIKEGEGSKECLGDYRTDFNIRDANPYPCTLEFKL